MLTSRCAPVHLHVFFPLRDLLLFQVTTEIKVSKSESNKDTEAATQQITAVKNTELSMLES